jgi:hypothetical protein
VSWSLDAHDLDLLAVQADERLLTAVGGRRRVEVADPAITVLAALAREVDARPVPAGRLASLRLVGQPTDPGRRANRRAALTGVAAAVAVLSIGGVAAAVGGARVSSVIKETVGSVFNGDSRPSTADILSAKLGDATAAWERGDAQRAQQILEDIKAEMAGSDPGELPPSLVAQVNRLESLVDAAESSPPPLVTSSPSSIAPAGTTGGEVSQPADTEADGDGNAEGTNQGQGQEKHDDGATPTSEPTSAPEPSDPADPSPTPSTDPTSSSPSTDDEDHASHGKSPQQDSTESASGVGAPGTAAASATVTAGKPSPGSQGQHKGVDTPTTNQALSNELAEEAAPSTVP